MAGFYCSFSAVVPITRRETRYKKSASGVLASAAIMLAISVSTLALSVSSGKATDYTTTVSNQDLQVGDTVTTTAGNTPGMVVGSAVHLYGSNQITTSGVSSDGVRMNVGYLYAIESTITTHGDNSNGINIINNGNINLTNVEITTLGKNSSGIILNGLGIVLLSPSLSFDSDTKIDINGDNSYGINAISASAVTFNESQLLPGKIEVKGSNSAAFHASGASQTLNGPVSAKIIFKDTDIVSGDNVILGSDAWTGIVDNQGGLLFQGTSKSLFQKGLSDYSRL